MECYAKEGIDQRFRLISPILVSPVKQKVDPKVYHRERANNVLRLLTNTLKGKLFLMPYNSGKHWILTVIDIWDDSVMYFIRLGKKSNDDFEDLIKL